MFLLRNHHLIVATQQFDVFKTNTRPPLWQTLSHSFYPYPLYEAKSICSFPPLVSVLRALSSISWHWASICHSSCSAGLFYLFLGLSCFLDSLAGLRRGPGWWHYHVVFWDFHFFLLIWIRILSSCVFWRYSSLMTFGHFTPRMYITSTIGIILQKLELYLCDILCHSPSFCLIYRISSNKRRPRINAALK